MKKLISTILALSIMMTMCIPAFAASGKLGDVNGDNKISAVDARMILQSVAGIIQETDRIIIYGDVNGDYKISAVDARIVLQIVAGIIEEPEEPSKPNVPEGVCKHKNEVEQLVYSSTCTEEGLIRITCNDCGNVREVILSAYGHDFGQYAFIPESCTEDGIRYMSCNNCYMEIEEPIPATGHQFKHGVCVNCGFAETVRADEKLKNYVVSNGILLEDGTYGVMMNIRGNATLIYYNPYEDMFTFACDIILDNSKTLVFMDYNYGETTQQVMTSSTFNSNSFELRTSGYIYTSTFSYDNNNVYLNHHNAPDIGNAEGLAESAITLLMIQIESMLSKTGIDVTLYDLGFTSW